MTALAVWLFKSGVFVRSRPAKKGFHPKASLSCVYHPWGIRRMRPIAPEETMRRRHALDMVCEMAGLPMTLDERVWRHNIRRQLLRGVLTPDNYKRLRALYRAVV